MRRIGVVVNPTAGHGGGRSAGAAVVHSLAGQGNDVQDLTGGDVEGALRSIRTGLTAGPRPVDPSASVGSRSAMRAPGSPASSAKEPAFGGGVRLAPHARMDDGLLDLVLVGPVSRTELRRVLPRVYRGRHVSHPAVTVIGAAG